MNGKIKQDLMQFKAMELFFINYISGSYSGAVGLPLEKLYYVLKEKKNIIVNYSEKN